MGCFTVARAITVRVMFTAHGIFSIWRLYVVTNDANHWYLAMALFGLVFETAVTLYKKRGQDWKWFCPSVFFYLSCLVPTIWFLELHELEVRIQKANANATTTKSRDVVTTTSQTTFDPDEDPYADEDDLSGKLEDIINTSGFDQYQWVRTLEQLLLLILILGRWLLPKGKLTHDQLSQLLLVYIGTAADIVEFFEAFNEQEVKHNRDLCKVILAIWSWSVLQFTLVFTATKARKDTAGAISRETNIPVDPSGSCCTPDVFGIIMSIFMQDGPFLVLRLLLIFKYNVLSYTNMFFTCKNTLVCMLLLYRLIVIQLERYQLLKASGDGDGTTMKESSSRAKLLLLSAGNTDQYYNYSTKVILRETSSDANEVTVTYVIRRHMSLPPEPGTVAAEGGDDDSVEDVRTLYETESLVFPGDFELHSVRSDASNGGGAFHTGTTTAATTPTTPCDSRVIEVDEREALVDPGQRALDRIIAGVVAADDERVFCDSDSDDSVMASLVTKRPPLGNNLRTQCAGAVPSTLALPLPVSVAPAAPASQCNNLVTTVVELHHHCANNSGTSCNSLNNAVGVGHTNLHFEQSPTLENVIVQ